MFFVLVAEDFSPARSSESSGSLKDFSRGRCGRQAGAWLSTAVAREQAREHILGRGARADSRIAACSHRSNTLEVTLDSRMTRMIPTRTIASMRRPRPWLFMAIVSQPKATPDISRITRMMISAAWTLIIRVRAARLLKSGEHLAREPRLVACACAVRSHTEEK